MSNKRPVAWVNRHMRSGMVHLDFDRFLTDRKWTVERLAIAIGYSDRGTMKMLQRGTIKMYIVRQLGASKYVIK